MCTRQTTEERERWEKCAKKKGTGCNSKSRLSFLQKGFEKKRLGGLRGGRKKRREKMSNGCDRKEHAGKVQVAASG